MCALCPARVCADVAYPARVCADVSCPARVCADVSYPARVCADVSYPITKSAHIALLGWPIYNPNYNAVLFESWCGSWVDEVLT